MSDKGEKQPTIGNVLLECHNTCTRIEDILKAVTASPPSSAAEEARAPEPAEGTLTVQLDADLRSVCSLSSRLCELEAHAQAVRREIEEVA